jgi:hypothetical protein
MVERLVQRLAEQLVFVMAETKVVSMVRMLADEKDNE